MQPGRGARPRGGERHLLGERLRRPSPVREGRIVAVLAAGVRITNPALSLHVALSAVTFFTRPTLSVALSAVTFSVLFIWTEARLDGGVGSIFSLLACPRIFSNA